jgi:uncharacterized RmlC-like cupin family protein
VTTPDPALIPDQPTEARVEFPSGSVLLRTLVVADNATAAGGGSGGLARGSAVSGGGMWMGISELPPGHNSALHHHEDQTTIVHVLSGRMTFFIGPEGEEEFTAGPGDFAVIPGGLVHREHNPSDEGCLCIVVRNSEVPTVTNLP